MMSNSELVLLDPRHVPDIQTSARTAIERLPVIRHARAATFAVRNGGQYRRWRSVDYLPWSERRFDRTLRMIWNGHI